MVSAVTILYALTFIEELVCFAKDKGATGIEYIPNFINLSKRNLETFAAEIEQVKLSGLPVSIIINQSKLQEEVLFRAIEISLELRINKNKILKILSICGQMAHYLKFRRFFFSQKFLCLMSANTSIF